MQLPEALRQGIEERAKGVALNALARAWERLSTAYRAGGPPPAIADGTERLAYLLARMPSTYAATRAVLGEIRSRAGSLRFESVLDVGAGPGSAAWAAVDAFDETRSITLLEKDRGWIDLGKALAAESGHESLRAATWQAADVAKPEAFVPHDLVIASYAAGEIAEKRVGAFAGALWSATRTVLVVVEAGTPRGFARVLKIREELLRAGAHMVAPCPHAGECPMAPKAGKDWCHFATRVERTSLHRRIKGGSLGFEDEKFSYIAVSREAVPLPEARIVGRPEVHSGLVDLRLCTRNGLRDERITRKEKAAFRAARRATWGGTWNRDDLAVEEEL